MSNLFKGLVLGAGLAIAAVIGVASTFVWPQQLTRDQIASRLKPNSLNAYEAWCLGAPKASVQIFGNHDGGDIWVGPNGQFEVRNVTVLANDDGMCSMAVDYRDDKLIIGKTVVTESIHFAPGPENARTF